MAGQEQEELVTVERKTDFLKFMVKLRPEFSRLWPLDLGVLAYLLTSLVFWEGGRRTHISVSFETELTHKL